MIKFNGNKEQLRETLKVLKSLRLNTSPQLFNDIFGTDKDMGEKLFKTYIDRYESNWLSFWGYLDESHQDVLLNFLLASNNPKEKVQP